MHPKEQIIKDYLINMMELTSKFSQRHSDYHSFILENSTFFSEYTASKKIRNIKNLRKIIRPKTKECFRNSQLFAFHDESLQYWEGFAFREILPFQHAWLVKDGEVIDVTLEMVDKKFKQEEKSSYFGLHISTEFMQRQMVKTQYHDSFLYEYWLSKNVKS